MFRLMRNFWATPNESEIKLRRRKVKNRSKRKRNKLKAAKQNDKVENNSNDNIENNPIENNSNENLIESGETQYLMNEDDVYENLIKQNYYEVEIGEEQYKYMLENDLFDENNECTNLASSSKENDPSTRNVPFEEEEERKKKSKDKWWSNDEEFDENFELTDEQKMKCAAFFIWIITLIIFFYFHNPDHENQSNRNGHSSNLDKIREMTRNQLPPGLLSQRNKFFAGEDPGEQLSKFFHQNQRDRSPYDDARFGKSNDEEIEENNEIKRLKRRKVLKAKKDGIKQILWWTENQMPNIYKNKKIFEYYNCEKTNCEFITDKTQLRESNAIVFNYQNQLNSSDLPSVQRRKMQLYIFYSEDAPQTYENKNELNEIKFNLSWSFTLDSSVQLNAGNLVFDQNLINKNLKKQIKNHLSRTKIKDCLIILANSCKAIRFTKNSSGNLVEIKEKLNENPNGADFKTNNKVNDILDANKSNDDDKKDKIANIVNLNDLEGRLKIIQNLTTNYEQYLLNELVVLNDSFIQFDLLTNCSLSNEELKELISKYRFVLIIENQMCKNYQTNYLYLILETNTIPILNGDQYGDLPKNSIIDLNKFQKMNNLTDYLKLLKMDFSKFYSHLNWKNYFRVSYKKNDLCELCEKLNQINFKNYKDLTSVDFTLNTWKLNAACFTFDQF